MMVYDKSPDKRAREMLGLLILQFGMFVTLVLQCHGLLVTYKLLEIKRNQMLCMHLNAKKNYLMRKRKDAWWRNMIGGNVPDSFLEEKI